MIARTFPPPARAHATYVPTFSHTLLRTDPDTTTPETLLRSHAGLDIDFVNALVLELRLPIDHSILLELANIAFVQDITLFSDRDLSLLCFPPLT